MVTALAAQNLSIKTLFAAGTHTDPRLPSQVEWRECAHPVPDARSVSAATRALEIARSVAEDECLLLLLSGGASAVMALPADGIRLADKQQTIRTMLLAGADIQALNTVRKHLSAIKGGRLAASCRGRVVTLAVSDVIGDDPSVIGSGPGVADPSTWHEAQSALEQYGGSTHLPAVRDYIARGVQGEVPETPKPGSSAVAGAVAHIIASRPDALDGARAMAESLGYRAIVLDDEVRGEARDAAHAWFQQATRHAATATEPICVLSAGETTVHVTGPGRGGRNQEFVLALVEAVAAAPREAFVASVGTDGIDGPTDAAGAMIDRSSAIRARSLGLAPRAFLAANNSYEFFTALGDLIRIGRTDTNVGDVQLFIAT